TSYLVFNALRHNQKLLSFHVSKEILYSRKELPYHTIQALSRRKCEMFHFCKYLYE
ncbi:unnamed protein product, partial [Schistosoma rodhaini]